MYSYMLYISYNYIAGSYSYVIFPLWQERSTVANCRSLNYYMYAVHYMHEQLLKTCGFVWLAFPDMNIVIYNYIAGIYSRKEYYNTGKLLLIDGIH